ncbi:MAG: response regulator [Bacteroidales bacterium]|nr:response regulator [Bacteroidales bacterium]
MIDKTLKNANILIVDDKQENIDVLQGLLELKDYTHLKSTTDPRRVFDLFKTFKPDIILLDLMMPHLDGFQVMEKLKDLIPKTTYLPILVLTADIAEETRTRALSEGAKDFLTKPFDLTEVDLRIKNLLETRFLYQQVQNQNVILEEKVKQRTAQLEKANATLAIAIKDIKSLDQAKTDFLHMASHEIRTPLNGILGGVQLLKTSELSDDLMEYLDILDRSTLRLEQFSKQALEISQIQTQGESRFLKEEFSFTDFLQAFTQDYIEKKGIAPEKIIFHKGNENIYIDADRRFIKKALEILVDNAITYSPQEEPVKIGLSEEDETFQCTIEDKGKGFPDTMLEKSLMQYTTGVEHRDGRTGLNLHLASIIIHHHKGNLHLSNNNAGGAKVSLKFPR